MRNTQSLAGVTIFAVGVLLLAPAGHAMVAPGDEGPSDPAVIDNTGAARFRIPIEVPPGPGGFAPNLELKYSSRSGDGPFGVGWTLGIPEIRCSGRFGIPDFANCAKYELDGVLLVRDPEDPYAYHTYVETFQRIRYAVVGNYWTVEQPNGTKLTFGQGPAYRILQGNSTARWLLQRMEDSFGNKIFLTYDTSTDVGSAYLKSVYYGAGATNAQGLREVRFLYQPRPDTRNVYSEGVNQALTRRLREIQVYGHYQLFRRYAVGYDLSSLTYTTDRSRLSWVQEFGTDCPFLITNPVDNCTGLPRQEFRYRDAPGSYDSSIDYRVPFGAYPTGYYLQKRTYPQLIGDINGDGLPDRLEIFPNIQDPLQPGTMRVLVNTGTGFSNTAQSALTYQASFDSLTYDQPRLDYEQLRVNGTGKSDEFGWNSSYNHTMFAMCSVNAHTRVAHLSQELLPRGVGAATSSYATLLASGSAPSAGWFEPRPTVKLIDINADGLADLVISVRLSGVDRHFNCSNGSPLPAPVHTDEQIAKVVFRNTGSGWEEDPALATGLPAFEEVIVKSSYQTEFDEPAYVQLANNQEGYWASSPCANFSYLGFELNRNLTNYDNVTAVCHVPIDLSPQFVDFNGDGYLDLALMQRDNPDLLWTGRNWVITPNFEGVHNRVRTRVWIQTPNGPQRWARAQQYDLPTGIFKDGYGEDAFAHVSLLHDVYDTIEGRNCRSWDPTFWQCGPNTFTSDAGVRLADMNGDGLADVVWNTVGAGCPYEENTCTGSPYSGGGYSGILLNKGGGSGAFSAWCASNHADALLFGGSDCPEAAAYVPPSSFISYWSASGPTSLAVTTGWVRDLNGDGLLDFARVELRHAVTKSWIQSPVGATQASKWVHNTTFDFPINWSLPAIYGGTATIGILPEQFLPGIQVFDINGDGSADYVSDQQALLSRSHQVDLIESVNNGRGGLIEVEYASAITQRDAALEDSAALDVQPPERPDGGDAAPWRSTPVVSRIRISGNGFAAATTDYLYAHPRYSTAFRSDLGFRLVEKTRPDASRVEEYFYQDHGRAGNTSKRLVKDSGQVVHRYEATWDVLPTPIPGSIPGVFVGRVAAEESAYEYADADGALIERSFTYDDGYGYNFVSEIRTVRPTATLVDTRVPVPDPEATPYVPGRVAHKTLKGGAGKFLQDTIYGYLDLDNQPTGPKIGSRSELDSVRGNTVGTHWVDVVKLRYDSYGNRIEEITPSPTGGSRSMLYCYDGDVGWCQGQGPSDQTSHSVMVASKDPSGKNTRFTPDLRSGIIVGTSSDYTDEPARRLTLDPFGRPKRSYVTPTGGTTEFLVAENTYGAANGSLRVDHLEYVDNWAGAAIVTGEIFGSFGGVWKSIAQTPSGFAGTITFSNPGTRQSRTTLPLACGYDPTCAAFSGQTQAAARDVVTDAVGRPVRISTPDGISILAYQRVANRWAGLGYLDAVLAKNAKGDLVERALDGNRVVWVDECQTGVAASVQSLAGVACGAADTTRYVYEPTGEVRRVSDPRAVASGNFADPNHFLRYTYDTRGRIVQIEDPDLDGTGFSLTTYTDAGTLESTTNARNQVRTYSHDVLGRLIGVDAPPGEDDYTVGYRPNEWQRWKDSSSAYERERTYDGWGRLKQTHLSVVEEAMAAWGTWSGSYFMDFEYDVAGRPVTVVYPESTKVRYEYEGAFLKRVCDLGGSSSCSGTGVVQYLSNAEYDALGRRTTTTSAAGTRTFSYDGSLSRLVQDKFVASSSSYSLQLNYTNYDELGNLTTMTGTSNPADIDLNQSYGYDRRNRLASWTKQGTTYAYGYDNLGNLTSNANSAQLFNAPTRPHSLESRANGGATYGHDADGNVTSILATGSARYFQFDSANRMVCADTVENGCALNRIHYDVDGRRVIDDAPSDLSFVAFVDDGVNLDGGLAGGTRIEIKAFGERIAYKRSGATFRTAGVVAPRGLPPVALEFLGGLAFLGLLAWLAKQGALVRVIERPAYAGVSALLVVTLVLGPLPGVRVSNAGGGGGASFYWELSDRLGTGMVMLNETGARLTHRTYSPFGAELATVGTSGSWLPRHFAGHLKDEDSGLLYMQARWMDPQTGTFMSVDPVVANAADPQAYNAYSYARGNPVNYRDPDGEHPLVIFIAVIAGGYLVYKTIAPIVRAAEKAQALRETNRQVASLCGDFGPGCEEAVDRQSNARHQLLESTKDMALNTPGTSFTGPPPDGIVDLIGGTVVDFLIDLGLKTPSGDRKKGEQTKKLELKECRGEGCEDESDEQSESNLGGSSKSPVFRGAPRGAGGFPDGYEGDVGFTSYAPPPPPPPNDCPGLFFGC